MFRLYRLFKLDIVETFYTSGKEQNDTRNCFYRRRRNKFNLEHDLSILITKWNKASNPFARYFARRVSIKFAFAVRATPRAPPMNAHHAPKWQSIEIFFPQPATDKRKRFQLISGKMCSGECKYLVYFFSSRKFYISCAIGFFLPNGKGRYTVYFFFAFSSFSALFFSILLAQQWRHCWLEKFDFFIWSFPDFAVCEEEKYVCTPQQIRLESIVSCVRNQHSGCEIKDRDQCLVDIRGWIGYQLTFRMGVVVVVLRNAAEIHMCCANASGINCPEILYFHFNIWQPTCCFSTCICSRTI